MIRWLISGCITLFLAGSVASKEHCRLALVLALDVSSSVDATEYNLQRLGLAAALDASEVRHAILHGGDGYVALSVYEWSGFHQQKLHLDWMALRSHRDIDEAVVSLAAMQRSHSDFPTAVGQALGFGALHLNKAPTCTRRVIDISGDGINNFGFSPASAYRHFPFTNVTVNGLVILDATDGVAQYYRQNVLWGEAAFLIVANGFEDFQEAMSRKLFREINELILGRSSPSFVPNEEQPQG